MEHTILSRLDADTVCRRIHISNEMERLQRKHKILMDLENTITAYIEEHFGDLDVDKLKMVITTNELPVLRNIVSCIEMEKNILLDNNFFQNCIFKIDGKRSLRDFINDLIDDVFENH